MNLAGETPTTANAERLIGRLLRKAQLQPTLSTECLGEALGIESAFRQGQLPQGEPPAAPPPAKPALAPLSTRALVYLYLVGELPTPATSPYTRHPHPHVKDRWVYLGPSGSVRWGRTKQESIPVAQATLSAWCTAAQARWSKAPPARPTLTLAALRATLRP